MRKGIIPLVFVVLLISLTTTLTTTTLAKPGPVFILTLQDKMGTPVKEKTFIIAIFDIDENERIAGVEITTDTEGKVQFELAKDIVDTHNYNITIIIEEYGKTFAFYYNTLLGSDLKALNETAVTGTHYWNLYFYAGTDLTNYPPVTCDIPVYMKDPEDPNVVDAAKVVAYIDGLEVWSNYVGADGVTTTTFNISDLVVEVDSDYHVKEVANTTFIVYALWTEHELVIANETVFFETTGDVPTLAVPADEITVYDNVRGVYLEWDPVTWGVTEHTAKFPTSLTNGMTLLLRSYTRILRVRILDWQGIPVVTGTSPTKVFIEFRDLIVRSGIPEAVSEYAPSKGGWFDGSIYWFWLPDVETVYGETYSVEVTYYKVVVYNKTVTFETFPSLVYEAKCSLVPLTIVIKDMEPIRQPLESSVTVKVRVTITGPITITTFTSEEGYVVLPPYETFSLTEGIGASIYWPTGYLPIPWGWALTGVKATYEVKVEWKTIWMNKYIDITHTDNNTIEIGVEDYTTPGEPLTFLVLGEVYQIKLKVIDLCQQPLYAADPATDPGAYPYAYVDIYAPDGTLIVKTTPTLGTGLIPIDKLPASAKVGGPYKVKLYWKGFLLDPIAVPEISNVTEIEITDNINKAVILVFPIRNIEITLTQWDNSTRVIEGLNVTLRYPDWNEPWATSDSEGKVKFYKVPVTEITGVSYTIEAYTTSPTYGAAAKTPYIRDKDANLIVLNTTISVPLATCTYETTYPTWIYSCYLQAVDTAGNVLKSLEVWESEEDILYYNVTLLILDADPNFQIINITWIGNEDVTPEAYFDPVHGTTGPEAVYLINSNQSSTYPHLFVAGAKYYIRVFYGGVMVYNYTIELPRPDLDVEEYYNETEFCVYLNETLVDKPYHLILKSSATPVGEKPVIKLYTWVVPTELYALTNGEEKVVSKVAFALKVEKVLSAVLTGRATSYAILADVTETDWSTYETTYVYRGIDTDGDGKVGMLVPVWIPANVCRGWKHWNDVWFGSTISSITVLASKDFETPGIVTDGIYAINYKVVDDTEYIGVDAAAITPWNVTNWVSDWKTIRTLVLDCIEVQVYGPDLRGEYKPLAWQYIEIYVGDTMITSGYKTTEDPYKFEPPVVGSITLPDGTTKLVIGKWYLFKYTNHDTIIYEDATTFIYTFKVRQNFDEHPVVKALGIPNFTDKYFKVEVLATSLELTKDHECGKKDVELYWKAIYVHLMDFDGKAIANMVVLAFKPGFALPVTFTVSATNGTGVIYVAEDTTFYRLEVYWRDTWFLEQAGKIPRGVNIYSSADERIAWLAGDTATIQTYVYIGLLKLTKADGTPLSEAALKKITVEVTWPDGVVTRHKPEADGTVKLIMNKDTIVTMTGTLSPESPHPQTPVGDYMVRVYWNNLKIYEAPISITKYRVGPAEQLREIKTNVVDFTITLTTPFGTAMEGAKGTIVKADGTEEPFMAEKGVIEITEAVLGKVTVKVTEWKKVAVDFSTEVVGKVGEVVSVTVDKVGKLVVVVQGARGQGLVGADVVIKSGGVTVEKGTTGSDGTYVVELPTGTYTVEVSKQGRKATTSATVEAGTVSTAKTTLDIFVEVAGWAMSSMEFTGIIVLIVLLVIVLFLIFHTYHEWRRKKWIAAAIVPSKPGA